MKNSKKILPIIESIVSIPLTAVLSIYTAVAGAKAIGHSGGSWGWGFMLALPVGFIIGLILSGVVIVILKRKQRLRLVPIFVGNAIVLAAVFLISFILHGLLRFFV